ncbi:RHS repeat domain-containing protein [Aquimarina sp. Aq107]|uniref:RHS repeat domain-containing protein n=1 Tax=Aquimarina sp. Aq107 TaxID=1191912 RepID=UPI000D55B03B|nr:RHS repeat-associated core domain-containing protein [Aquimarina sp. Aq107]
MKNFKTYSTCFLVLVLSFWGTAQDLNWYQNTGFDIINSNTVSGNGNLLSHEVLSQEQTTGHFEITNFKVDGNNLGGFVETKFSSASIFLSQTVSTSLNGSNGYTITIVHNSRNDLVGNRYTITAKKPDGTELGKLEDVILQTTDRIRIEKLSSTQLRFLFNNQVIATVTDANLSWNRAGIQSYNLIEVGVNPGILSMSYAQSGFEITDESYGPFSVTDTDKNWVSVNSYGITENVVGNFIGASVSYYDDLGKGTQSQTFDTKAKKTWASEIRYDSQGRPALSTLSAPIGGNPSFTYKDGFIKKSGNADFNISDYENTDLENPTPVTDGANTLGWYYSENNNSDPYQDITNRPYSRTIYSDLNPGTALKTIGGNKMDDQWKQGHVFSMPAGQELSKLGAFGDSKYDDYKIIKTVSRDIHGIEAVVFTDTDGRTLAAARSGNEEGGIANSRTSSVKISEQGFVDIHIPVGRSGISLSSNPGITVYDLITEEIVTTNIGSLSNGFYRIAITDTDDYIANSISVNYPENYYDYSLNEYDKAGRLLSSKQPLVQLESTFEYNALGQLTYTKSPDEGEAWFKYRSDGQIRYSQNSKQLAAGEFSYTNYDQLGRPTESGVLVNGNFTTANPDTALPSGTRKEQHLTIYDALIQSDKNYLSGVHSSYANPSFLSGNVAKTENENTTTYYSYDIYGRVQWIVQNIADLGDKTIDYEYDPITSQVNRVVYQKHSTSDLFIHKYTYDTNDYSLTKVETATNINGPYTEHATYEYNETGALKTLNLAEGLQKIDYVYALNGALKSINDPTLDDTNNPAQDIDDLFGMNLHYYDNDYTRTNTPRSVARTSAGINQYNGNIKSITWNTNRPDITNTPNSYYYTYNKNNWLTGASFNQPVNEADPSIPLDLDPLNQPVSSTTDAEARRSITLENGFSITATTGRTFSAKIITDGTVLGDGDYNVSNITYDANGNIQSLNRNKDNANGSNAMDKLSYAYKTNKPNQLLRVDDTVGAVSDADDIEDQDGNNYEYNEIGQLVKNNEENIEYLYNASGLVTEVRKDNQTLVKFFYNDKNHRVRKESYNPNSSATTTTFYVRDAAGTAMAIYNKFNANVPGGGSTASIAEHTIYGANRLGVYKRGLFGGGKSLYQLTDHLGNVRAVVTRDQETGTAMAVSATDYYPFGMPMPNRTLSGAEGYRYAYQGQEVDPETGKEAFELRLWDARIGRWLTTDPAGQYHSPYMAMGNNPVIGIDPDGAKNIRFDSDGNYIGVDSDVWWHNLLFGTRGQYGSDENGWTNFEFSDTENDVKNILDGVYDKLVVVNKEDVRNLLINGGAFDKDNRNNVISYMLQEGVGKGELDYAIKSKNGLADAWPGTNTYGTIYVFDDTGFNNHNFGNFLLGASAATLQIQFVAIPLLGAHANSFGWVKNALNGYSPQLDSMDDQLSIKQGFYYARSQGWHYKNVDGSYDYRGTILDRL